MSPKLFVLAITLTVANLLQAQKAQFYVLTKEMKPKSWCYTDTEYKTYTLPSKLDSEKRKKVINGFKKRMGDQADNVNVVTDNYYITDKDIVVIYQYEFKNKDCIGKVAKSIKSFKTSDPNKVQEIFESKIKTSFVSERIISSKILYAEKPLDNKTDSSIVQDFESYIRNQTDDKQKQNSKKSTAIGVRG